MHVLRKGYSMGYSSFDCSTCSKLVAPEQNLVVVVCILLPGRIDDFQVCSAAEPSIVAIAKNEGTRTGSSESSRHASDSRKNEKKECDTVGSDWLRAARRAIWI